MSFRQPGPPVPQPQTRTSAEGCSWRIRRKDSITETSRLEKILATKVIMGFFFQFSAALPVA